MNGVAGIAETPGGGSNSEGPAEVADEQLVSSEPEAVARDAATVIVNDVSRESSLESNSGSPVPNSTIPRVDSLSLAFEAIQGKKSATCVAVADASDSNAKKSLLSAAKAGGEAAAGEEDRPPHRRASSLKVANRQQAIESKKAVRFADVMGLDLALVRHVFDLDSPPEIPPQAMRDLVLPPDEEIGEEVNNEDANKDPNAGQPSEQGQITQQSHPQQQLYLSPSFAQPGSAPNFKSRITSQKVVLEKANYHAASPAGLSGGNIRGLVRVANLGFEKQVRVRSTVDSWRSSTEVVAEYQPGGSDGYNNSDQFAFSFSLPDFLSVGDRVIFCVAYSVNSQIYWDNNFGDNYSFHCVALHSNNRAVPEIEQAWARYV